MSKLPPGLPSNVPAAFQKRLEGAVSEDALTPAGPKIAKEELEFALDALKDSPVEVQKSVSAWLGKVHDQLAFDDPSTGKAVIDAFQSKVDAKTAAASQIDARVSTDLGPPEGINGAMDTGLSLAVRRDEVSWNIPRGEPHEVAPKDYWPPFEVKLDLDGEVKVFDAYVSKRVGLQNENRVDDMRGAESFKLLDRQSGKLSDDIDLAWPAAAYIPEDGPPAGPAVNVTPVNPEPEAPKILTGGKLSRAAARAIDSGIHLALRDEDWGRLRREPSERDHFMPPYEMTIDHPETGDELKVLVYLSNQTTQSWAQDPKTPEEAQHATLYDPESGEGLRYVPISFPARVTLASND